MGDLLWDSCEVNAQIQESGMTQQDIVDYLSAVAQKLVFL